MDLDISTGSASRDRVSHQQDLSIRPALGDVDVPPGTFQPLRMVSAQGLTQKIDDSNQEPVRLAGSETIPLSDEGAWDMQTVGAMPDVEARSSSDSEAKLKEANEQIKKLDRDLAQQYGHAAARHEIIASLRKRVKELETEQKVSARDLSTVFDQLHDQTDLMNSMIGLVEERDRLVKEKGDFLIRERDFQGGIARIRKALGLRDAVGIFRAYSPLWVLLEIQQVSWEQSVQDTCLATQILSKDRYADSGITNRSFVRSRIRTPGRAATMLQGTLWSTSEMWRNEQT